MTKFLKIKQVFTIKATLPIPEDDVDNDRLPVGPLSEDLIKELVDAASAEGKAQAQMLGPQWSFEGAEVTGEVVEV